MKILQNLRALPRKMGKLEKAFAIILLLYLAVRLALPNSFLSPLATFALIVVGVWVAFRLARTGTRRAIWRLRNRLLVTYLFIGVVPVLLIITLAGLGAYALASQIAVYLAASEIDRKVGSMQTATETLARTERPLRKEVMRRLGEIYQDKYPGMEMLVEDRASVLHWPEGSTLTPPAKGWTDVSGVAFREGRFHAWSHVVKDGVGITACVPLTRRFLSEMVAGLGEVYFLDLSGRTRLRGRDSPSSSTPVGNGANNVRLTDVRPAMREMATSTMPPPANRFDIPVQWISLTPASDWESAGKNDSGLLLVRTRFSALFDIVSSRKADEVQGLLPFIVLAVGILFLVVEVVALIIGISLARTITRAVHSLYEGTQRVMRSDFSHRIQVVGRDQLAELGSSFNTMTGNLERLLVVAKEKERLQAEIEIAREVQEQLYPKSSPTVRTLRLTGLCQPARMVSGDYYDFQRMENTLALAIGDVAGKGISAALLMASIQSAMRMELRSSIELAAPSHRPVNGYRLSTARMVSDLNQQLHATTAPEKYATFFFGIYDEIGGALTYTNAGHLPPILIRGGRTECLNVNGTVVGAFPLSVYDESKIQLQSGDLLVCYTDGITEPENEYGEMFGEERLIELVSKNLERDDSRIIELVMDAVRQWTGSPELHDDMTVLLARKQ